MSKISVLYKPSRESIVNNDLTVVGYYGYDYKIFYGMKKSEFRRKIKIEKVPAEKIGEVYEYCEKMFTGDEVIVIISNISGLFEE